MVTSVISNEKHRAAMQKLAKSAADTVSIAVPFFDKRTVEEVIGALRPGVEISFIFDWPREPADATAISPSALELLWSNGHEVLCVAGENRLHGKVYLADQSQVMVTSANLTAAGMGSNAEIGVMTTDGALVDATTDWMSKLRLHRPTAEEVETLRSWLERPSKKVPPRPTSRRSGRELVEAALDRAKAGGHVTWFEHVPTGAGRNAFLVEVPGVRGALLLRGRVSNAASARGRTRYHFEINYKDAKLEGLDGLVLVPLDDFGNLAKKSAAPVVFAPYDLLVGRKPRPFTKGDLRGARKQRRLSLEQKAGRWTLHAKKHDVELDGCANSTAAFRDLYV